MSRRPGKPTDFARPLTDDDGRVIPLARKLKVKLETGRMLDPCWVVTAGKWGRSDYAYVQVPLVDGTIVMAHRHAWAAHHGSEVPAGMVIHHKCFHKHCVNPTHLQLVTFGENSRQSNFEERYVLLKPEEVAA